jgi:hypothetical protein
VLYHLALHHRRQTSTGGVAPVLEAAREWKVVYRLWDGLQVSTSLQEGCTIDMGSYFTELLGRPRTCCADIGVYHVLARDPQQHTAVVSSRPAAEDTNLVRAHLSNCRCASLSRELRICNFSSQRVCRARTCPGLSEHCANTSKMGVFQRFGRDEKQPSSPPEYGQARVDEIGVVDEDHDDLHREMKPRQLSTCF